MPAFGETRKMTNLNRPIFTSNLFCLGLQVLNIQVASEGLPNSVSGRMRQIPEFEGKSSNIRIFPVYRTHPSSENKMIISISDSRHQFKKACNPSDGQILSEFDY
jgi:hypothetical protein